MQKKNVELSEREIEILRLVATGASNKEIAQQLFISTNTVKVHLRNIFHKIGVSSRTEAAMYAVNHGIVQHSQPAFSSENRQNESTIRKGKKSFLVFGGIFLVIGLVAIAGSLFYFRNYNDKSQGVPKPVNAERWREAALMTTNRFGIAAAVYNNHIYAIAGKTNDGVIDTVERYDPNTDTWSDLASKKTPVYAASAGVINGKIYVPGGRLDSEDVSNVLEIYDPQTDSWSQGANLPQPLSAYGLAVFEGKLYLFGGWNGNEFVTMVYEYDPSRKEWIEKSPMRVQRGYLQTSTIGEKIFVVGGDDGKNLIKRTDVYLPIQDDGTGEAWYAATGMPYGRARMGMAAISSYLQVIGGISDDGEPSPALLYNVQADQWTTFEPLNQELWTDMVVVALGNRIYILGGKLDGVATDKVLSYQAIYTVAAPIISK